MLVVLSRFNVSIVLSVYSGLNSAPAGLIFVVYDANGAEFTLHFLYALVFTNIIVTCVQGKIYFSVM